MKLKEKIIKDLSVALKQRDDLLVSTLRFLLAEIHNLEIEKQRELKDEEVIQVLQRQIKQRKESISAFSQASREDLALKEKGELEILNKYLPKQLEEEELKKIIKETIIELSAGSGDFGKVMGIVMGKVRGNADGNKVAGLVKELLIGP